MTGATEAEADRGRSAHWEGEVAEKSGGVCVQRYPRRAHRLARQLASSQCKDWIWYINYWWNLKTQVVNWISINELCLEECESRFLRLNQDQERISKQVVIFLDSFNTGITCCTWVEELINQTSTD